MDPEGARHGRAGALCFVMASAMVAFADGLHVSVNATGPKQCLLHFWSSTGFSPPANGQIARDFLSSVGVARNLQMIGALPNNAVRQVRVHWLMDLIEPVQSQGRLAWNYERLDGFLDKVMGSGLRPRFEFMGNPGEYFTDFSDKRQAEIWKNLVRSIVRRYSSRYGSAEVSKWSFETWNEPDLRMYNVINMTLPAYLMYFRATELGVRTGGPPRVSLSGPAGLFKNKQKHPLCWGLLEYCNKLASQNTSCGLSEITYHHKGSSSVTEILSGGLSLAKRLNREMPYLKNLPVSNDEADPLSGWWRPLPWREDVRMAAMMTKSAALHLDWVLTGKPRDFRLLGGDHGFLAEPPNFFNQRTLLARFPMNDKSEQVVRKPSLGALFLMAMLGNRRVKAEVTNPDSRLSVIATSDATTDLESDWTTEVLLTVNNGTEQNPFETITINVSIDGLENGFSGSIYRVLQLSSTLPHPASIWNRAGRPDKPNAQLRAQMREAEGPHVIKQHPVGQDVLNITLSLALPSVTLIQICGPSTKFPGRVSGLHAVNITFNEVLLIFRDNHVKSKCVLTFQVEFCKEGKKSQCIELEGRNMYLAYHYAPQSNQSESEGVRGRYRVRAIDLWGRHGPYSKPAIYG